MPARMIARTALRETVHVGLVIAVGIALVGPVMPQGRTTRVSVDSAGVEGNYSSYDCSISSNGRYVAFESSASNLVSGDFNGDRDIFLYDRQSALTIRVSVDSGGIEGNNDSYWPSVSADGRYVAFNSSADNLVHQDTNDAMDVFVHDCQSSQTTRISVGSAGIEGNDGSYWPSISDDGQRVVFHSLATNLVPGDTNSDPDVFVHDLTSGQTTRVSVDSAGVQGNDGSVLAAISADGRYVAFVSQASNLVLGDTNHEDDVFLYDLLTGTTSRVSVSSTGGEGNALSYRPSVSGNGQYVAFESHATNLVQGDTNGLRDIFVHDRQLGETTRVSVDSAGLQSEGGHSYRSSISADGRHVAYQSWATNLVPQDTNDLWDIFLHDRQGGDTMRESVDTAGNQGNGGSTSPSISGGGRFVAFLSGASNLVEGDTNGDQDVFVRDRLSANAIFRNAGANPAS